MSDPLSLTRLLASPPWTAATLLPSSIGRSSDGASPPSALPHRDSSLSSTSFSSPAVSMFGATPSSAAAFQGSSPTAAADPFATGASSSVSFSALLTGPIGSLSHPLALAAAAAATASTTTSLPSSLPTFHLSTAAPPPPPPPSPSPPASGAVARPVVPPALTPQVCALCQKQSGLIPFRKCGRCKLVRYCSVECQQDDWYKRFHHLACKPTTTTTTTSATAEPTGIAASSTNDSKRETKRERVATGIEAAIGAAMDGMDESLDSVAATERATHAYLDRLEQMRSPRPVSGLPAATSLSSIASLLSTAKLDANGREPAPVHVYPKRTAAAKAASSAAAPPNATAKKAASSGGHHLHDCANRAGRGRGGGGQAHAADEKRGGEKLGGGKPASPFASTLLSSLSSSPSSSSSHGPTPADGREPPQRLTDTMSQVFAEVRRQMREQAAAHLVAHVDKFRRDYLHYHTEFKGRGGPMGCYRADDFHSGRAPMPAAKPTTARVTMLPMRLAKLPSQAPVTTWMLPDMLTRMRADPDNNVYPAYLARIGAVMNPKDVCWWFVATHPDLLDRVETVQLYVPDGVALLRSTESDTTVARAWSKLVVHADL